MAEGFGKKTRVSNTGSISRSGFSIGVDWLTFSLNRIQSGADVEDVLKALETLADDQIDFSTSRPRLEHYKMWAGTGMSAKGLLVWYNPPHSSNDSLVKSLDGNLITHPGLLPAGHYPVTDSAAEFIRKRLPEYAVLHYDHEPALAYDPIDGSEHQHHGYSIVATAERAIDVQGEVRFSMPARYLDNVKMDELAAYLLTICEGLGLRCSRFDAALDDHEKRIPLSLVEKARCDRNFFNVRTTSVVWSDCVSTNKKGQTIYFGSRQSDVMMRVYDKTVESKGRCLGNRWESEFHGKKADRCMWDWLAAMAEDEQSANRLLIDLVLGTVDFRDKSAGDKNRERCPVLPWFDEMCRMLSALPVRLRIARPVQTMQRGIDWAKKSVAPTLASIAMVLGEKFQWFIDEQVTDGKKRMTKQRRKMVAATDPMKLCY